MLAHTVAPMWSVRSCMHVVHLACRAIAAHASLCSFIVLVDRPSILLELLHEILHLSGLAQPAPGALDAIQRLFLNGAISRKMRPTKRSSAPKSANRTTVEWIQQRVSLIWYSMRVHSGASTSATAPRRPCSIESHGCGHSGEDWLQSDGCGFRGDVSTPRVACSRPRRRCRGGRSARPPPLMGARNEGCMWVLEKNATAADLGFRTWFTDCLYPKDGDGTGSKWS